MEDVKRLIDETGKEVSDEFYQEFWAFFRKRGFIDDDNGPMELLHGIAQAMADRFGYAIVLQGAILISDAHEPDVFHKAGWNDLFRFDPTIFVVET